MRKFNSVCLAVFFSCAISTFSEETTPSSSSSSGDQVSPAPAPNNAPAVSYKTFKEAYAAGNQGLKDRELDDAVAAYGAAEDLATNPKAKSQAANAQGWAYLKARKLGEAKKAFARSVEENGDNKLALKNLGAVEYNLYEYGLGGVEDLKDAVKNLEASGENQEDLDNAKAALSREESLATATPGAEVDCSGMNFKALCALSDKLQEQGQTDEALKVLEKAASKANSPSGKAAAANRQGKLYLDSRQPTKAEPYFEEAAKEQPKEKVYLNNLGWNNWMLYQSGKGGAPELKKAVDAFYQMNALDPSYHGESLKMTLDELKEVDPEAAKAYSVKDESASDGDKTGNAKDDNSKENGDSTENPK